MGIPLDPEVLVEWMIIIVYSVFISILAQSFGPLCFALAQSNLLISSHEQGVISLGHSQLAIGAIEGMKWTQYLYKKSLLLW